MYCKNCGRELSSDARYCSFCGILLDEHLLNADIENNQYAITALGYNVNYYHTENYRILMVPIITLLIALIMLGGYYLYEIKVSKNVESMRQKAEAMALEGKFDEAYILIKKAAARRPNHEALEIDMKFMEKANEVIKYLDEADQNLKVMQFDKAISSVEEAERKVPAGNAPFYDALRTSVNHKKAEVTITEAKYEIGRGMTMDEFISLLIRLNQYKDIPEADEIIDEIKKGIVDSAYNSADEFSRKKLFNEALDVLENALQYVSSEKLESFKQTILKQKSAYETDKILWYLK